MDAALLGSAVIAVLTQLVSLAAFAAGARLPAFVKQILAFAVATGFINFSNLHPFSNAVWAGIDVTTTLNMLVTWAGSMFLHDVATQYAPKPPLAGVGGAVNRP